MSVTAAELRKLGALRLSPEQMEGVLDILACRIEADEARKAKQNERQRRSRDSHASVTPQACDTPSPLVPPLSPAPLTPPIIPPTPIISSRKADESKDFEDCWAAYPRKVGKGKARKAFLKAKTLTSAETIKAAISAFAVQCRGKETEFIPHMATWLNAERWQDADLQEAKHPFVSPNLTKVYVQYGTDAGDAWTDHFKTQGKVPPRDGKGGWWFPSEYPPQEKAA